MHRQGFRVELAQLRTGPVRLRAVQTRLFFASIWAAGTVAATSLGWTAVALFAQRVGDEPIVEQSLVVLPLNANTSLTPVRARAAATEVEGAAAENVVGDVVGDK